MAEVEVGGEPGRVVELAHLPQILLLAVPRSDHEVLLEPENRRHSAS